MILGILIGLIVGSVGGFVIGIRYTSSRLPQIMAEWTPEQLKDLAQRVADRRPR